MIILDGLWKLRNLSDYSGETVPEAAVRQCTGFPVKILLTPPDGPRVLT